MPSPDSRGRLYRGYVTTHTGPSQKGRRGLRRYPVLNGLPTDCAAPILDIGCGAGELIAAMVQRGYQAVTGIDVSEEQVELAHGAGRTEVQHGDVFAYLPGHAGQYAAITAADVFEHFDRDEVLALLDAAYAALAPSGVLVAQVPNATSPFFGNYAYGDFTHRSVFTARSVRQICLTAGFIDVAVFPVNPVPHGVMSTLRRAIWSVYAGIFKLALASETGQSRGYVVTQNLYFVATKTASPRGVR